MRTATLEPETVAAEGAPPGPDDTADQAPDERDLDEITEILRREPADYVAAFAGELRNRRHLDDAMAEAEAEAEDEDSEGTGQPGDLPPRESDIAEAMGMLEKLPRGFVMGLNTSLRKALEGGEDQESADDDGTPPERRYVGDLLSGLDVEDHWFVRGDVPDVAVG